MGRIPLWIMAGLLLAASSPLQAELIGDYEDSVYLRDHETVRYRLDIDYGRGAEVDVDIFVRGLHAPPRVRVLEGDFDEVKRRRDTNHDYILDFDFTAKLPNETYFIEVDSAHPWKSGRFDISFEAYAPAVDRADASFRFSKFFIDRESGNDSDHYDCAARPGGGWPLAAFGLVAGGVLWLRRREQPARA